MNSLTVVHSTIEVWEKSEHGQGWKCVPLECVANINFLGARHPKQIELRLEIDEKPVRIAVNAEQLARIQAVLIPPGSVVVNSICV